MFSIIERVLGRANTEPRPWSPDDWAHQYRFDTEFSYAHMQAQDILDEHKIPQRMGVAGDQRARGLLERELTARLLKTYNFFTLEKDRGPVEKVITGTQTDIQSYVEHFFAEDPELASTIRLSICYLYSLATNGCQRYFELPSDRLALWEQHYGVVSS